MNMLKVSIRIFRVFFLCTFSVLILDLDSSFGGDFSLGPLFSIERDRTQNHMEIDALGPFVTYKKRDKTSEFGLRPLFYSVKHKEKDSAEFDLLYPASTYRRNDEDWRFQFLVH